MLESKATQELGRVHMTLKVGEDKVLYKPKVAHVVLVGLGFRVQPIGSIVISSFLGFIFRIL